MAKIITLKGTGSILADRITINENFKNLKESVDTIENLISSRNLTIEGGNGITISEGNIINIGGELESDIFIEGANGAYSIYLGSFGPGNNLNSFNVGTNNGIFLSNDNTTLSIGDSGQNIFTDGSVNQYGIQYGADYSATYTNRSLVDKGYVDDSIQNSALSLEWQKSALSYIIDNTISPPTENIGDRYILSADGGAPNANYDGASAGDIVEFDGSVWVATTPTTGMFISADDENTLLYYWGGSSWTTKDFEKTTASNGLTKNGFDIQLGGTLTSDVIIDGVSGTTSMFLGSFGPDKQLGGFSVGANDGISLFNYENNLISSGLSLYDYGAVLSSGLTGITSMVGSTVLMNSTDNRRILISSWAGIPNGSGESFTINGTTFTEGVDFIGQGDAILDTETIAGLNYSGVTDFVSVEYFPGDTNVYFNFTTPAVVSNTFSGSYIGEGQYNTQMNVSSVGASITVGNTGLVIGDSNGENKFNDNTVNQYGIQYGADYSANFTDRSLVDKEYVDISINNATLTSGNGITVGVGNNINLGGTLDSGVTTIAGASGTSSALFLGNNAIDENLVTLQVYAQAVGFHNYTTYDGTGVGTLFSSTPGGFYTTNNIAPGTFNAMSVSSGGVSVTASDNRNFSLFLYGAVGGGESFTINGTTFTEGVDFTGQGDAILDAATIAGLNYSGITDFVSVDYAPGSDTVYFTFANPVAVSTTITDGYFNEYGFSSGIFSNVTQSFIKHGNTTFSISESLGTIFTDATLNQNGIQYAADYSSTYTDRSLVDKEYVDISINNATLTSGNGITVGVGNTIDLGGTLTNSLTNIKGTGSESLIIGGFINPTSPENLLSTQINSSTFYVGSYTSYVGSGVGTLISSTSTGFSALNTNSSTLRTEIYNTGTQASLALSSKKIFRFYLIPGGGGIPNGSGETFTINGITFTEGIDFTGQGDPVLDAATIAGLNYSGVTDFVSVTDELNGYVRFEFNNPATVSETLSNVQLQEYHWDSIIQTNENGVTIKVGDDDFYGTPGTILTIGDKETIFTDNSAIPKGIQYGDDYSANYTDRSLVDKEYVLNAIAGKLSNVVDDTTPQLGGNLDVNGNKIVSVSNGNIDIEPNGTGNVLLGNFTFDADQTVGAGEDNYVLTYDNATGLISLEAAAGGGLVSVNDASGVPTYYSSLKDAVNAIGGNGVVTLHSDISVTTASEMVTIGTNDKLTINGNGYTITHTCNSPDNFHLIDSTAGTSEVYLNNVKIISNGTASGTYVASVFGGVNNGSRLVQLSEDSVITTTNNHIKEFGAIKGGTLNAGSVIGIACLVENANVTAKGHSGTIQNCTLTIPSGGAISTSYIINCIITADASTSVPITLKPDYKFWNNILTVTTGANNAININSGSVTKYPTINNCEIYHYGSGRGINAVYIPEIHNTYVYAEGNNAIYTQQGFTTTYNEYTLNNVTMITNSTGHAAYSSLNVTPRSLHNCRAICLNAANTQPAYSINMGYSSAVLTVTDCEAIVHNNSVANFLTTGSTSGAYIYGLKMGLIGTGLSLSTTLLNTNTPDAFGNVKIG